jgi:hypothetical protein
MLVLSCPTGNAPDFETACSAAFQNSRIRYLGSLDSKDGKFVIQHNFPGWNKELRLRPVNNSLGAGNFT